MMVLRSIAYFLLRRRIHRALAGLGLGGGRPPAGSVRGRPRRAAGGSCL